MDDALAYAAVVFGGLTLFGTIAKDIFGGSTKLANKFHDLDKTTTLAINELGKKCDAAITQVRTDFLQRSETHEGNARVGLEAITANIHALQLGLLEFRAKMAEEYMRRDSYYKASEEIKRDLKEQKEELKNDMQNGFDRVEKTLGEMAQAIESARKSRNTVHA